MQPLKLTGGLSTASSKLTDGRRGRVSAVLRAVEIMTVGGPAAFTVVWLTGPLWHPAYDPISDSVSELAVGLNGWVQTVSFMILAASSFGLAVLLALTRPRSVFSVVGAVLVAAFSIGIAGAGAFRLDSEPQLHQLFSAIAFFAIVGATVTFWRHYRSFVDAIPIARFSLGAGVLSGALLLVLLIAGTSNVELLWRLNGAIQRLFILSWTAWLEVMAIRGAVRNRG
jgi:hypothetical protein